MLDFVQTCRFVRQSGLFASASVVMADMASRMVRSDSPELYLAMALTVQQLQAQHVCVKLPDLSCRILTSLDGQTTLKLPDYTHWRQKLSDPALAPAVRVMNGAADDEACPSALLVVDQYGGCYLQRQWSFEQSIIQELLKRAEAVCELPDLPPGSLHKMAGYFRDSVHHPQLDYQQLAVMMAMRHKLLILSGGPGTGKTTVAAAILAQKIKQNPQLRIILAAPTAKAAVRLQESLLKNLEVLADKAEIAEKFHSLQPATLQRILGSSRHSHEFKHNRNYPLDCDLLLVDECSMVSQHLMARTLEALPEHADLLLLGDRYQLSSVEAGSVLADICDAARCNVADAGFAEYFARLTSWQVPVLTESTRRSPLDGCVVELQENHRFAQKSVNLGSIAAMIRNLPLQEQTPEECAEKIAAISGEDFNFIEPNVPLEQLLYHKFKQLRLENSIRMFDLPHLAAAGTEDARKKAFALLNSFKILAPAYQGSRGIWQLNSLCMKLLGLTSAEEVGTPLLILKNDYRLGLFNGDIGLVAIAQDGRKRVFFENHQDSFDISELPEHEIVFAMSVHKSQGSGFGEVLFVMPDKSSDLMTREMVYTAMTRAENQLTCIGSPAVLSEALQKQTVRMSNLTVKLLENPEKTEFCTGNDGNNFLL